MTTSYQSTFGFDKLIKQCIGLFAVVCCPLMALAAQSNWQSVDTTGTIHPRHEAGYINIGHDIYLIGGRRIQPVNHLNSTSFHWQSMAKPPIEIHHFQPVVFNEKIYIVAAMTGKYPHETPLSHVWIFDPKSNQWTQGDIIPKNRRRGGAGASIEQGKIYIQGGITDGHWTGTVSWFDQYNPKTGQWKLLPDMPHKRDHFQSAIIDNKLYAAGGRITSAHNGNIFNNVVTQVDVFNFVKGTWSSLDTPLTIGRAGNATLAVNDELWIVGGESARKGAAHNEVEIFNTKTGQWRLLSPLIRGRHGSGLAFIDDTVWISSGSGNQGGGPELTSTEKIELSPARTNL